MLLPFIKHFTRSFNDLGWTTGNADTEEATKDATNAATPAIAFEVFEEKDSID